MQILLFFIVAFFIGSIPTAYLVGKYFCQIDIRKEGSGNVGATNAFRVLGKGAGVFVLVFDFAKGLVPTWVFSHFSLVASAQDKALWIGLAAILGHMFTPFLRLKGGKGIATGAGVLCGSYPALFLATLGIWLGTFLLTHIVSISSLAAVIFICILSWIIKIYWINCLIFSLILALALLAHRSNIKRLIKGEEKRVF